MVLMIGLALAWLLAAAPPARAGLGERDLAGLITPPMQLGTRDAGLPIWTLLDGGGAMIGYVFESVDLAPIPGFSGTPIDLLITVDKAGTFMDVRVLSQNEPVFVDGLGVEPMNEFVRQYAGKSVATNIKVGNAHNDDRRDSANTYIDGVTKATASVRIINETVLASALKVARERMAGVTPKPASRPKPEVRQAMDWNSLVAAGLLNHLRLTNRDVAAGFAGTQFAADAADADPDGLFLDLWYADIGVPTIAAALLTEEGRRRVARHVESYEEAVLVLANGPYSITGENFVRNSVPDLMSIHQQGFPVNLRDADVETEFQPGLPHFSQGLVLRIDTRLGFDPATPWDLGIRVRRDGGMLYSASAAHDFTATYQLAPDWFEAPKVNEELPQWLIAWTSLAWEIGGLLVFLAALALVLARQSWAVTPPSRLTPLRLAMLAVTLGFVGWYGQGQLSIVNVLALDKALVAGDSLAFFLHDPFTVVVWLFTFATLLVWGRGSFCGWLCPFGALQELVGAVGRRLGLREMRVPWALHRRLLGLKYVVLGVLLVAAPLSPALTDRLVEVEPFKTVITLMFVRHWPFNLYAIALLGLSLVVYKGYCRYLCPLGAGLALLGRLRRWDWIPRRVECGSPCQLCAVRCRYQAIDRAGRIDYAECFQCLDCVAIVDDATTCVPLVMAAKRARSPREKCDAPTH